jgi:hypothetical protein
MINLNLSLEEQLVLLNSRVETDKSIVTRTFMLLERPIDWNRINKLAYNHGVAPLLYKNLSDAGVKSVLPDELKALYYITASRNNNLIKETGRVLKAFNDNKLKSIILKGIYLINNIYINPALRPLADIDILVHKKDLTRVIDIFTELGYVLPQHHLPLEVFTKYHFHLTFMSKENSQAIFEIHWDLRDRFKYSETDVTGIWGSATEMEFYGEQTMTMSHEDSLIYLCQHLDRHGYINRFIYNSPEKYNFIFDRQSMDRLIWFVDIYEYLNKYGNSLNWDGVIEKTGLWDKDGSITSSLYITDQLYQIRLPRTLFDELTPPKVNLPENVIYKFIMRRASCRNWNRDYLLKFFEKRVIGTYTKFPFHPIRFLEVNFRTLLLIVRFPLDLLYHLFRKCFVGRTYG